MRKINGQVEQAERGRRKTVTSVLAALHCRQQCIRVLSFAEIVSENSIHFVRSLNIYAKATDFLKQSIIRNGIQLQYICQGNYVGMMIRMMIKDQ